METMKEIKAYVRNSRIDKVIHSLREIGVKAISVTSVEGIGALVDPAQRKLSIEYVTTYCKVHKIEVVCRSEDANLIVETIQKIAHTGSSGDGVIFVSPIERAVKIKSGEEGHFVLDHTGAYLKEEL